MKRSVGAIMMMLVVLASSGRVVVGQEDEAVLDSLMRPVKANTSYSFLAVFNSTTLFAAGSRFLNIKGHEENCPGFLKIGLIPLVTGPVPFMFISSSDDITLTSKFNVKSVNPTPCGSTGLWNAAIDKPVFVNGTESSIESTFSFRKSESGDETYHFVSGNGEFEGVIGVISRTPILQKNPTTVMNVLILPN